MQRRSEDLSPADAHLIAAAPEMEAALEAVLADANIQHDPAVIQQAEDALRKARGETQEVSE